MHSDPQKTLKLLLLALLFFFFVIICRILSIIIVIVVVIVKCRIVARHAEIALSFGRGRRKHVSYLLLLWCNRWRRRMFCWCFFWGEGGRRRRQITKKRTEFVAHAEMSSRHRRLYVLSFRPGFFVLLLLQP